MFFIGKSETGKKFFLWVLENCDINVIFYFQGIFSVNA